MWGSDRTAQTPVGEVGGSLSHRAEVGWGFDPTHGEHERNGDELFLTIVAGKNDGEAGGTVRDKANAVEAVRDVYFDEVDRAMGGVGVADGGKETVKRASKLHGLGRGAADGVVVDAVKGEVDNEPGAAFALGDDAKGRQAKVGEILHQAEGEDSPKTFGDKIRHFVADEVGMSSGGSMGAAAKAGMEPIGGPRRGAERDIGAV
jgi:hypothetical protein